jgi:hypothetical protein
MLALSCASRVSTSIGATNAVIRGLAKQYKVPPDLHTFLLCNILRILSWGDYLKVRVALVQNFLDFE